MSCLQWLLLHIPSFLLVFMVAAVYIVLSIVGLYVIRAFHSPAKLKLHNDVAGFIFATIGVTYAVLVAFVVIITWQNFDEAHKNVSREANYIVSLYHDTRPLPASFRNELKSHLVTYVRAIIEDEWPMMIKGEQSAQAQQAQDAIWKLYGGYLPHNETQKIFFTESLSKLALHTALRLRRVLAFAGGALTPSLTKGVYNPFGNPVRGDCIPLNPASPFIPAASSGVFWRVFIN